MVVATIQEPHHLEKFRGSLIGLLQRVSFDQMGKSHIFENIENGNEVKELEDED